MITKKTAYDIWIAYDEIEKGEKLVADMEQALKEGKDPNPRDMFGERRNLQLGVPSGESSHRLFAVAPKLAIAVIRAHVAEKRAMLTVLCERAGYELTGTIAPREAAQHG